MGQSRYPYEPGEAIAIVASLYSPAAQAPTLDAVCRAIGGYWLVIWPDQIGYITDALEVLDYDATALDAVRAMFGLKVRGQPATDSPPIIEARIVSRREGEDDRLTPPAVTSMP